MDKNKYLQTFKDEISIFTESYQQKKVLELDEKIGKMMQDGKKEEDIIREIGTIEELVQKVYEENHLNYNKKSNGKITQSFEKLFDMVHCIIDIMSKNSTKENFKIIIDLFLLILFICVIKIPFIVVRDFGNSLLDFIPIPIILNLWHLLMEFVYIIIAIVVFISILKKWFQNLNQRK